jgi:hypothetical protein
MIFFLGLTLSVGNLDAQVTTGAVTGTVLDPSNAPIPDARVTLKDMATGASRMVTSNQAGEYFANLLPIGRYEISAEKVGFSRAVLSSIQLALNQTICVDITLRLGAVSQTVEVTGVPPLVDATQSAVGTIETEQRIVDLPLNGRNFVGLADLGTGVNSGVTGATNNGTTFETARANQSLAVNGLSVLNNNFLLDGLDNNEFGNGAAVALPPPDAIAEFRTEESSMEAEFGRGGAAVNVVLKSGSNQIHGDAWEFLRNEKLDAKNFFDLTRAPFKRNQFGFSLGGPIRKNRTFFFADYQGTRVREDQPFVSTVPTAAERQGDFTALGTLLYDPATTDPATGNRSLLNSANPYVIPSARINAVGQNVASIYPLPNLPGLINNYADDPSSPSNESSVDARVDHVLGDADHLFAHYTFDTYKIVRPSPLGKLGGEVCCPSADANRAQTFGLGWTHTFSSNLLNEARFGFTRYLVIANGLNFGQNLSEQLGIPYANRGDSGTSGLSYIAPSGFTSLGDSLYTPEFAAQDTYELSDTLNWVRNGHTLKAGFVYLRQGRRFLQIVAPRGQFQFSGAYTENLATSAGGNSVADLLLGIPIYSEQDTLQGHYPTRYYSLSGFAQDDWHVRPNLTFNFGLRYDLFSPAGGQVGNFDLKRAVVVVSKGPGAVPYGGVKFDKTDWGPRVGLVWTPWGLKTLLVKSAFGVFYGPEGNGFEDLGENPPWLQQTSQNFNPLLIPTGSQLISAGFPATVVFPNPLDPAGAVKTTGTTRVSPRIMEWNLTLAHEFGSNWIWQAGYVGTRAYDLWNSEGTNLDQPYFPLDSNFSDPTGNLGRPYFNVLPNLNTILPLDYAQLSFIYHSFQTSVNKQFAHGFNLLFAYTFAKSLGNTDGDFAGEIQNAHNVGAADGQTTPGIRHRLVVSYLWELPVGHGQRFLSNSPKPVDWALGGWKVSGITTAQTGQVFTGALSFDPTNTGTYLPLPDLIHSPMDFSYDTSGQIALGCPPGKQTLTCYYNQSAFAVPPLAPGQVSAHQFGNEPVNILRGPDLVNFDFALIKNFAVREGQKIQLRAEFFNLFNHPNFDLPGGARPIYLGTPSLVDVPGGASITATLPDNQREIQVALKYIF